MTMREDEISAWETLSRDCGARGALRYGTVFIIVPVWRKKGALAAALHACNMSVRGKAVRGRAVWRVSGSCWVDFRSQPNTLSGQAVPAVSRTPPTADSELEAEGIPALR